MKRQRHTPEQIIRKLRVAEQMLSEGKTAGEAAKALEVSEQTLHRWRNQYGGIVVDEFTREALAIEVERSIDAEEMVAVLKRLASERGAPANIRADNGPELTAAVLREWCRLGKTGTAYIEPGSPWQNPYVESFNARLRDELLNTEVFTCLEEAQILAADWRADYNAHHPHSALGMMSPARFAASWQQIGNTNVPANPGLSLGVDR